MIAGYEPAGQESIVDEVLGCALKRSQTVTHIAIATRLTSRERGSKTW